MNWGAAVSGASILYYWVVCLTICIHPHNVAIVPSSTHIDSESHASAS